MILGSGASPGDPLTWQTRLKRWLKAWMSEAGRARPVVGFCYGHQLLAHLDGAEVVYLWSQEGQREKASGLRRVTLHDEPLGLSGPFDLIVSHREGFSEPPAGWRSIAHETHINGARAVEAMHHERSPWWGFQAHPEAVEAFLHNNDVRCALPQPYDGHKLVRAFLRLLA
jgi:GMP synthase (glutamine-hydrolysing)